MGDILIPLLVGVPLIGAAGAWRVRAPSASSGVLLTCAAVHAVAVALLWSRPGAEAFGGWLAADPLGLVVLGLVSVLFLVVAHYAANARRDATPRGGRAFVSCLLVFLSAASVVALSQQLALFWVGIESTTLAIAPLIYHHRDRRSLEAVWKYLMLSSVGIAFALLAVFLVASAQPIESTTRPLMLADLIASGPQLDRSWLRIAMVFALVGFGTKMGLAPLHAWKPDTYGEAPHLIGALMSGVMTSCAFLGVARFTQIAFAAGIGDFVQPLLIAFGLFSLAVAAAFILGQADVKRLLAYSSVEHMGLLALGLGVGGAGAYGSVLHLMNNAIAKAFLFLVVGNLVVAAGTSAAADMRGMLRARPVSAFLMLAGMFAVTGAPPFGLFISEFTIVTGAVREHHPWVAAATVVLLAIIFVGIAAMIVNIAYGEPSAPRADLSVGAGTEGRPEASAPGGERFALVIGPALLAAVVLLLGIYIPPPVRDAVARAAQSLGGAVP